MSAAREEHPARAVAARPAVAGGISERAAPALETGMRTLIREVIREEVRAALKEEQRPDEYLSTQAAAELAGVVPATIRRWVSEEKLTGHRVNHRVLRISRAELETLLRGGGPHANDGLTPEEAATRDFG